MFTNCVAGIRAVTRSGNNRGRTMLAACALMLASFATTAHCAAGEPAAGTARGIPATTVEDAIDIAKQCVIDRNIQVAGSFIESARYEHNRRGDRGPYWLVTWAPAREIKGGQVFVSVFGKRQCEITFGE
jgi:hypothetical protein